MPQMTVHLKASTRLQKKTKAVQNRTNRTVLQQKEDVIIENEINV